MEKGSFNETEQGTPQGGVISPLLANIGLHGLEKAVTDIPYRYPNGQKSRKGRGIIRYADDFVIMATLRRKNSGSEGNCREMARRTKSEIQRGENEDCSHRRWI